MMDDNRLPVVKQVRPSQLGWLRRPELDEIGIEVWELPNGELFAHKPGKPLVLEKLLWPK